MKFAKFVKYYSLARISKYHRATGYNKVKTIQLYHSNLRIAQTFHPILGSLEVILRNGINDELTRHFKDKNWIINQKNGFMQDPTLTYIDKNKKKVTNKYLLNQVLSAEKKLSETKRPLSSGRIIAEQNLGFWTSLFEKTHYRILKGSPIGVFKNLPSGYGRNEITTNLKLIREFRNRISHNESLCFVNKNIDFSVLKTNYKAISDLLNWIDPELLASLKEVNQVMRIINKEEKKYLNP